MDLQPYTTYPLTPPPDPFPRFIPLLPMERVRVRVYMEGGGAVAGRGRRSEVSGAVPAAGPRSGGRGVVLGWLRADRQPRHRHSRPTVVMSTREARGEVQLLHRSRVTARSSPLTPSALGPLKPSIAAALQRCGTPNVGIKAKKKEIVIPDPDYRIPVVLLGIAGGFVYQDNLLPAATVGLLGLLLLFQTTRVRFVFDEEALEVKVGDQLQESGENVFVGGKNRWKYSTFVNWELWWPNFPILVYFKERQTKPEGQIHFFPVIFNGKQLYDVMVERAGPSKTSSPKQ